MRDSFNGSARIGLVDESTSRFSGADRRQFRLSEEDWNFAQEMLRTQMDELTIASERLQMANQNLLLATRRFEELFASMPVASFTFDSDGMIHEWNRAAEALFKRSAQESVLRPVWSVIEDGDHSFWNAQMVARIFTGERIQDLDWTFSPREGQPRHLVANVFAMRGVSGEIIGAISANLDITERKVAEARIEEQRLALEMANQKLETLAVTDGLTGLWNHRRFQEELERTFSSHTGTPWPLSLILLDIDNFKSYNDTFGHPAGDDVLKQVSKVLSETVTDGEVAARYGGEEFALLLPDVTEEQSLVAAERFRLAIERFPWSLRTITASLGIASLNTSVANARDLIQKADKALYASKQLGRNCSTHFDRMGL